MRATPVVAQQPTGASVRARRKEFVSPAPDDLDLGEDPQELVAFPRRDPRLRVAAQPAVRPAREGEPFEEGDIQLG